MEEEKEELIKVGVRQLREHLIGLNNNMTEDVPFVLFR